jgi:hypothetical protein
VRLEAGDLRLATERAKQASSLQPQASSAALLEDLRGRLARARGTPAGPRRAALLVALRYRIAVERASGSADGHADLAAIEAEARELERGRA